MLYVAHWLIVALYVVLPIAALARAAGRARRARNPSPFFPLITTMLAGVALGIALALVYAAAVGGGIRLTQVLLASYFAAGLLILLKMGDVGLRRALRRIFMPGPANPQAESVVPNPVPAPSPVPSPWPARIAGALRVVILFAVGLPYVMASVMTYRPKVAMSDDPMTQLGYTFDDVTFRATDGMRIVGWWIPALDPPAKVDPAKKHDWGKRTVILCHGLAANKSNQLIMARAFVPKGYNVLIFDFRAHGASGGQLATFGDLERRDVLGAVKWVRGNHHDQAEKIYGVGASMGAAALIAAAADPSDDGQAIQALAVYAGYDSLPALARSVTSEHFLPPLNWLTLHIGLPLASLQTGTNLAAFVPGDLVQDIWPRPILFIHGFRDEVIQFEHGERLFERAPQPKEHIWIWGEHNDIIANEAAARHVREFFEQAAPVPVI